MIARWLRKLAGLEEVYQVHERTKAERVGKCRCGLEMINKKWCSGGHYGQSWESYDNSDT